ncbi:WD repeat-containing protein [Nitzschia inconspicua]|uniref:DDB1- and CUL4-associated factor 13 n=1 Tax=Nitzschia inconspicua TaxID=303405 RepID=A0A9K3KBH6_9STRA|nr:WD repeat-containing protein [Nitzschia inconspicua]
MKVKALSRSRASTERECSGDLRKHQRNLDPVYHPMQRPREMARAITAAKMNRMFAHPLIGNFGNGHQDAVYRTCISRSSLLPMLSGGADGQVKLWDMATRSCVATLNAHTQAVNGLVFGGDQDFYSCSQDGTVRRFSIPKVLSASSAEAIVNDKISQDHGLMDTWRIQGSFQSIDHQWDNANRQFATASDSAVQLWTPERSTPLQTHDDLWGSADTVNIVRFHPSEPSLLANCSMDRGVGLFDLRTASAMKKTVLRMRCNDLQWNPMEPLNFVVANEDFNAYTFDMRKLKTPSHMYKGHTSAVMSVSWAPTGREFVTGSYDRTLRIFNLRERNGVARDIYHTKRMQRVFTVNYSMDNSYIISGSDDTNVRLWKARASEKLGQLTPREEAATQYRQALIKKYEHLPTVQKIYRSRKIPKVIKKQTQQAIIQKESAERKQANRVKHSKPGTHTFKSERKKVVDKEID